VKNARALLPQRGCGLNRGTAIFGGLVWTTGTGDTESRIFGRSIYLLDLCQNDPLVILRKAVTLVDGTGDFLPCTCDICRDTSGHPGTRCDYISGRPVVVPTEA